MNKSNKMTTMAVVAVMMAAAFGGALIISDDDMTEEADAELITASLIVLAFVVGALASTVIWYLKDKTNGQGEADAYTRQIEAAKVAESILHSAADFRNALNNYINIWKWTNEHFIRTAEIMAAAVWSEDAEYHPADVLVPAGVYTNSSHMMSNAAEQISHLFFQKLNERMAAWNADPVYSDMMTLQWIYDNQTLSTKGDFGGWLKNTATPNTESNDKVFISGGDLWIFGGSASIRSATGQVITLSNGLNDLDAISAFTPGVYELQTGRQYAGNLLYVIDSEAAAITPGFVMKAGETVKLATLYNNQIVIDGSSYNKLSVNVIPDGAPAPEPAVIHSSTDAANSVLVKYASMNSTVNQSIGAASLAASTVWSIFDKAGESSAFLTTLMVPNFFDNIQINQAQQELITVLALAQLAEFSQNNNEAITADDFHLSGGSFQLFMRGDLIDANGNKLFSDVIFTPFYFVNDETITTGNNTVDQPAIVAIWGEANGQPLSTWNFTSSTEVASLVSMTGGESMYVYEILYDDDFVNSVHLDVKQIEIISAEDWPIYIPPRLDLGDKDIIQLLALILMILGALAAITVFLHKRLGIALGGVICIVIGFVIMSFQDSWFGGLL